jgi:hypothetical protein
MLARRASDSPRGESKRALTASGQSGNVDLQCLILSPILLPRPTAKAR